MPMNLENRTAVVCGASQGIGLATAQHLAGLGARVIIVARNAQKLEAALQSLEEPSRHAFAVADFSHPADVQEQIGAIVASETVHILVNNTGGPSF